MPHHSDNRSVAIVTGAANGIGLATSLRLLRDGWAVVGVDVAFDHVPAELAHHGDRFHPLVDDITRPGAGDAIVAAALARFGGLGLLVNNAGIGGAKPVAETPDDELQRFLDVNFIAAFRLSRAALRVMQAGAAIIQVASVLALRATPSTSSYTATKAALAGLTRQMAAEYGPRGIRTNAVAPGLIETRATADRLHNNEAFRRLWADATPWPRLGRPDDIAAAIAFLASDDAQFVNGHVLVVDGGWSAGTSV
jgi:3-oxoacyl-[acyl-carrier protein] reductase